MKSKKVASKQAPMTNAQQQQFANSVLQVPVQIPQQVPIQQVPIQQQQMQYPIQVTMPQPGVAVPTQVNRVGYYGNRSNVMVQRQQQPQGEMPAIFNDD